MKWTIGSAVLACALGFASAAQASVLILGAGSEQSWNQDVKDKIAATGLVAGSIDLFAVREATPTLAQLQAYDAVLVYSDYAFADRTALGNVLADYVDGGGGVVQATFSFNDNLFGMGGRFRSGGYEVFNAGPQSSCGSLGAVAQPGHAILQGVTSFDAGSSAYCAAVSLAADATLIASWSSGIPLVGVNDVLGGKSVGLNFYPPSSDVRSDFWAASTDGARLLANALNYAAGDGTPVRVPEPGTLALVALGGLALARRRRS